MRSADALRWATRALALAWLLSCAPEQGPAPVAWDRTPCARCGMLVSDPAWAAQRHLASGAVLHYDDPGCLLADLEQHLAAGGPADRAAYFHHHTEERWLTGAEVAFVAMGPSPMGYDLAAVSALEVTEGLPLPAALARVARADRERGRP